MATARLKLSPSEFWNLTPMELEAYCDAYMKAQPGYVPLVTREEFEALKARFPDKPKVTHGR